MVGIMEKKVKEPIISCTDVEGNFSLRQGEASLYIPSDFKDEESLNFLVEGFYKISERMGVNIDFIASLLVYKISERKRQSIEGGLTEEDFMNNE